MLGRTGPPLRGRVAGNLIFLHKILRCASGAGGEPYGAESIVSRRLAANRIAQDCIKIVTLQDLTVSGKYTEIGSQRTV